MTRRRYRTHRSRELRLVPSPDVAPSQPTASPPLTSRVHEVIASGHWTASYMLRLARQVGGAERLANLSSDPLVRIADVDPARDDTNESVAAVRTALDAHRERLAIVVRDEQWVIVDRLVQRLGRSGSLDEEDPTRLAAALVWLALRSQEHGSKRSKVGFVWHMFAVSPSPPRAYSLHRALGFPAEALADLPPLALPDPMLLTAQTRRSLIEERDRVIDHYDEHLREAQDARPVLRLTAGGVEARAHLARPRWAFPGQTTDGQRMIIVATDLAATPNEPRRTRAFDDVDEVIGLTVPDTYELVHQMQRALLAFGRPQQPDAPPVDRPP